MQGAGPACSTDAQWTALVPRRLGSFVLTAPGVCWVSNGIDKPDKSTMVVV